MKKLFNLFCILVIISCNDDSSDAAPIGGSGQSQGGSLSRFAIVNDYLYIVNEFSLTPIDISNLADPVTGEPVDLGIGIETIFSQGNTLFIGSRSAVFIYSIADPSNPQELSVYSHATGCDPVVVRDNFAYVTLKEGVSCTNFFDLNVLEVINVANLRNPVQVRSIEMLNPAGLGIGCNNKLFVCEGDFGLVQFDISDPANPKREVDYPDIISTDVIVKDEMLIVTGKEGVFQYDCTQDSLQLISKLPITIGI